MVIKTDLCQYTAYHRTYPGKGQKFIAKDGKVQFFISAKADSLFLQRIKPVKLRWIQAWRRMNIKREADEQAKKFTRKVQKLQKAIAGMTVDDIKKKNAQKLELRQAAKEAAAKEAKLRMQKKGPTSGAKPKNAAKPKAAGGKDASKIGKKENAALNKGGTKKDANKAR